MEHFVTYFDHKFLLQGLALYSSLRRQHVASVLWVLCLDDKVEEQLSILALEGLEIISLRSVETPALLAAKKNRSRSEYFFTLTPFVYGFVFNRDPAIDRVTYLDADIYFWGDPSLFLQGFIESDKSVLLTEHAYAPEYQLLAESYGIFCVQFLTIKKTAAGTEILCEWQRLCLENCSTPAMGDRKVFGDQKYLDEWPGKYPGHVFIVSEKEQTLAPWNINYYQTGRSEAFRPVMFHFQSLRVFHHKWLQLCFGFDIRKGFHLYLEYVGELQIQAARLDTHKIPCPIVPFGNDHFWLIRLVWRVIKGTASVRRYSFLPSSD